MKIKDLKKIIDDAENSPEYLKQNKLESEVVIALDMPSIGGIACETISNGRLGFYWDSGKFILTTSKPISHRTENEQIFEQARDILSFIATKPTKKQGYEQRTALTIFKRLGIDIMKYQKIFHRDLED